MSEGNLTTSKAVRFLSELGPRRLDTGDSNNSMGDRYQKSLQHGGGRYIHIETMSYHWAPPKTKC